MPTATNTPTTISPEGFANAMKAHWQGALGNVPSPALLALWETMAKTFNAAIESDGNRWSVLQPPTGTGKTQGLSVHAALTAKANHESQQRNGILIVTRMIEQADELKEAIDRLAGFECAVAKHSENKVSPEEMRKADVLIITHAAYVLALSGLCKDDGSRWNDLVEWDHGRRHLTVIDEALANVIDEYQVTASVIRQSLSYVTPELRKRFPTQVEGLEMVQDVLERIAEMSSSENRDDRQHSRIVWRGIHDGRIGFPECLSMLPLRQAMTGLRYDLEALRKDAPMERQWIANMVDNCLASVEAILSTWAYYAKKGVEHTFNASRLLIPDDLPAPVVLDATANQNFLWELLGDRADIKPIPANTRSYRNVTLHVSRISGGTGKSTMIKEGQNRIPRLLSELETRLSPDRSVFLCVHQKIEHLPLKYSPAFNSFSVGHWGAVDGRNDWQNYDTAVIFGLPYRDHVWATNAFFALQGLQDNGWMRDPQWKSYSDVRDELQIKQMTVSIIQAINRIQCRRVIDEAGNCPASDVFIVLPTGKCGDRLLEAIQQEMPHILVKNWAFNPDGKKVMVRKNTSHEALLKFMANRLPGQTTVSTLRKELSLSPKMIKSLKAALRLADHPLTIALSELGVTPVSSGYGKGAKFYLLKSDEV